MLKIKLNWTDIDPPHSDSISELLSKFLYSCSRSTILYLLNNIRTRNKVNSTHQSELTTRLTHDGCSNNWSRSPWKRVRRSATSWLVRYIVTLCFGARLNSIWSLSTYPINCVMCSVSRVHLQMIEPITAILYWSSSSHLGDICSNYFGESALMRLKSFTTLVQYSFIQSHSIKNLQLVNNVVLSDRVRSCRNLA